MGNEKKKQKEEPYQKFILEIEPDGHGVRIKHTFIPALDMKNEENNNKFIVECFLRVMDSIKGDENK